MKILHEKDGQNAHSKVAQCCKGTINVCHGDDDVYTDAMALDGGILGGARPEIGKRLALQKHDE